MAEGQEEWQRPWFTAWDDHGKMRESNLLFLCLLFTPQCWWKFNGNSQNFSAFYQLCLYSKGILFDTEEQKLSRTYIFTSCVQFCKNFGCLTNQFVLKKLANCVSMVLKLTKLHKAGALVRAKNISIKQGKRKKNLEKSVALVWGHI